MSFYGNVINPPVFFSKIAVGPNEDTVSVEEGGLVLKLIGDETVSVTKTDINTIQFGQVYSNGLYLQCKDDSSRYFKLTVDSNGVLEIYEVEEKKEAN